MNVPRVIDRLRGTARPASDPGPGPSPESSAARTALIALAAVFLGFGLFSNLPALYRNFLFADQATYFAMTQSIAHDGDLEYTTRDLIRYLEAVEGPPIGIFLKKGGDGQLFFAKSFAYSLFAAPFVRLFGINGHPVLHALLLGLVLAAGFAWMRLSNRPAPAFLAVATFLFASVGWVYFFWISPDFFNFSLVFLVLFLTFYKVRLREAAGRGTVEPGPDAAGPAVPDPALRPGRLRRFLLSGASDYAAAFLAGILTFSKPPNAALLLPLVLVPLLRRNYRKAALTGAFFLASALCLFGANFALTSDWNFMGGERKTFISDFPYEKDAITFDTHGWEMTSEGYFERMLIPPKFIALNSFYYLCGRFTGLAWYYFPAVLFLGLFLAGGRRAPAWRWLILAALAAQVFAYIVLMPTNYGGGGGSLANRYVLHALPLVFFLPARPFRRRHFALAWIWAAVFIGPILLNPLASSANPAAHAKRFPIKALPLELTQVNEWPTNTNPWAYRVSVGAEPNTGMMHFLDDNFNRKSEPDGVWTRGDRSAEMVLKTYYPLSAIRVRLTNNVRRDNRIKVRVGGRSRTIVLQPRQRATLEFPVGRGFQMKSTFLHRLVIGASKGSIPYYEQEASQEKRNLGVFFELELVPAAPDPPGS